MEQLLSLPHTRPDQSEQGVEAACREDDTPPNIVSPLVQIIPANVGHRQPKAAVKFSDLPGNYAQTLHAPILCAALKQ